jgi:hypothetical protein
MIAVEVNGKESKFTWEIIGIYRDEDMLATQTDSLGKYKKRSKIEGGLNMLYADWKKHGCH